MVCTGNSGCPNHLLRKLSGIMSFLESPSQRSPLKFSAISGAVNLEDFVKHEEMERI